MDRLNFYYRQKVAEQDMDLLQDNVEGSLKNAIVDLFGVGMVAGGVVTQHAPTPDLTVDVSAGRGYDYLGERVAWSVAQNVDCSVDRNGQPTAVTTPGYEKWITVLAYFDRLLDEPRVDGHGSVVYYHEHESFKMRVVQGVQAPAGTAQRPAHPTDGGIILADILLAYGTTAITNSMISASRREGLTTHSADEIVVLDAGGRFVGVNVEAVLAEIDAAFDSHVGSGGAAHAAVTTGAAGFMSPSDKSKLDGIPVGAEPNQNAYGIVKVGESTAQANAPVSTFEFAGGANISLQLDTQTRKLTVGGAGQWPDAHTVDGMHAADFALVGHTHPELPSRGLYVADETEQSVAGTTETTVLTHKIVKCSGAGLNIAKLAVVANLRVTGGTGTLKVYVDGVVVLTIPGITNTSYQLKWAGPVSVSWADNTLHTVEVKLVNSSSSYATYKNLYELYTE